MSTQKLKLTNNFFRLIMSVSCIGRGLKRDIRPGRYFAWGGILDSTLQNAV